MITFCSLYSGSSGNASYLGTENGAYLIDCGLSGKHIFSALSCIGADIGKIRGILVTHEHSDHIRGVGVVARKLSIPVMATEGTWEGMRSVGDIPSQHRIYVEPDASFFLGDMEVMPFATPHDANDSVGYRFFVQNKSIAIATDMGSYTKGIHERIVGSDIVLLESNYDVDMLLQNPKYPTSLKNRIQGKKGHLSNDCAAKASLSLLQSGTQHILLGHLSRENNAPALAYQTTKTHLLNEGVPLGEHYSLHVAPHDCVAHCYRT